MGLAVQIGSEGFMLGIERVVTLVEPEISVDTGRRSRSRVRSGSWRSRLSFSAGCETKSVVGPVAPVMAKGISVRLR